jgi:RND family efflux transporter MFP subunit
MAGNKSKLLAGTERQMNYETGFSRDMTTAVPYVETAEKQPRSKLWLVGGLLLVLAILAAAFFMFNRNADSPVAVASGDSKPAAAGTKAAKDAPVVTVVVPGRQLVENVITATGTLAARQDMPVGAVGEGGMVRAVLVQPGAWVRKGQVLAVVDRQVQVQQTAQLQAQISAAQAEAALAEAEYNRSAALIARGFISKADVQRKAATRDGARARVRVAMAQLSENNARVGRLDIRAPEAGLVLTRAVEPGQVVGGGGGVLFRIAQGGNLELRAQVAEADLVRMAVGQGATVTPVGTTQAFGGQIWQIAPVIDPQSRQGTARIALGYSPSLRPGGFATAKITSSMVEAPVLPESAVLSDDKGNYVYVVGSDSRTQRRDVVVGSVIEAGASITSGLSGQERVVLAAGGFLSEGELIQPNLVKR